MNNNISISKDLLGSKLNKSIQYLKGCINNYNDIINNLETKKPIQGKLFESIQNLDDCIDQLSDLMKYLKIAAQKERLQS